ncbi:hypothetical protein F5884DRAFT_520101 [Xylogone sp. PMI_703]|nr:hypothetical protein F5884DRAFT_520101 [Xylogone sp. PMI_703]
MADTTTPNPTSQRGKQPVNPSLLRQHRERPFSIAASHFAPNSDINSAFRLRFEDSRLYQRWKNSNTLTSGVHAKRVLGTALHSFSRHSIAGPSVPEQEDQSSSSQPPPDPASTMLAMQPGLSPTMPQTTHPRETHILQSGRGRSDSGFMSNASSVSLSTGSQVGFESEKPICSGNGVSASIILAEPIIYLSGIDHSEGNNHTASGGSAILRGKLQLNVTKSVKIKSVTLKFTGRARTEWPEGIPPTKMEFQEEESLRTQILPFFNALYEGSETGYGTQCNYVLRDKSGNTAVTAISTEPSGFSLPGIGHKSRASALVSTKDVKRLSLQSNQSRSFTKGESPFGPTPQQKGYKLFYPGVYEYSFELPIDNNSPETTKLPLASVIWQLEALIERAGTFKANLQGFKEIPVIRSPSLDSLELVEPISISRNWEDQLHYEIMISGKSFPLGSKIPVAFKLTPLAKVQIHKLKVFVTETVEYYTSNQKITRKEPTRKIQLIEKCAGKPLAEEYSSSEVRILAGGELGPERRMEARAMAQRHRDREARRLGMEPEPLPEPSENILGDIDLGLETFWGQTEIEMNVQLPTCSDMEKDKSKRLHHDCTWKNVNVHHWIKVVMRISRADPEDPTGKKRRHFEISIDSPFTILNCRATQANISLPEYSGSNSSYLGEQYSCGCPNSSVSRSSSGGAVPTLQSFSSSGVDAVAPLTRPAQAHLSLNTAVQRPIHMMRAPSYNPPAFDAEDPPPPLATPPPLYDQIIGTPSYDGLADYFARLSEAYEDESEDDDLNRTTSRGRVNIPNPRTPGARVARSMEIDRNFMFNPDSFNGRLMRETERATTPTPGN